MMSDNKDNQVAIISKKKRGDAEMDTVNNAAEEEEELMVSLDSRSLNNGSRKKVSKNVNFLNNFPSHY
jgi:hypothetical protein